MENGEYFRDMLLYYEYTLEEELLNHFREVYKKSHGPRGGFILLPISEREQNKHKIDLIYMQKEYISKLLGLLEEAILLDDREQQEIV